MTTIESDGYLKQTYLYYKEQLVATASDFQYECFPTDIGNTVNRCIALLYDSIHIPFLPMV